ncbi:MAG: M42 family metallopeptidase [Candidatus Bathyarchaeota archaeon]|nr:M42 family metallopeptidase [Candidatus Bathyarchaeota archaeon]
MGVGKIVYHELEKYADSVETDNFGNVISLKKASVKDAPKVMLAGHMDEIGLIVKHIDDKGFLFFEKVGGISPRVLFSQPVVVHGKKGPVSGLINCKPPETPEEANKIPDLKAFFIDVGAKNKAEAEKLGVRIGDSVTFERPFKVLGSGNILASKAFDDRVGVCVIIETMKKLAKEKVEANVYGVADVQEEVGCRGAQVAAYRIAPNMAIAVDITLAGDIPGVAEKDQVTKIGAGPAIKVMDEAGGGLGLISHPKVRELLVSTAEEEKIPYQMEVLPRGSTDAAAIHLTREGVPSGVISIPTRYAHSYEILDVNDVVNAVKLLTATIKKIKKNINFK